VISPRRDVYLTERNNQKIQASLQTHAVHLRAPYGTAANIILFVKLNPFLGLQQTYCQLQPQQHLQQTYETPSLEADSS
jgi:hypothetical protein